MKDDSGSSPTTIQPSAHETQISCMKLEFFLDPETDVKTPWEWIQVGVQEQVKGTCAKSRYCGFNEYPIDDSNLSVEKLGEVVGGYLWKPCFVLEYSEKRSAYLIEWCGENGLRKWVARSNLKFDLEAELFFRRRMEKAEMFRRQFEFNYQQSVLIGKMLDGTQNSLHPVLNFSLESSNDSIDGFGPGGNTPRIAPPSTSITTPTPIVPPNHQLIHSNCSLLLDFSQTLPDLWMENIKRRIGFSRRTSRLQLVFERCVEEVGRDYSFAMKRSWLFWNSPNFATKTHDFAGSTCDQPALKRLGGLQNDGSTVKEAVSDLLVNLPFMSHPVVQKTVVDACHELRMLFTNLVGSIGSFAFYARPISAPCSFYHYTKLMEEHHQWVTSQLSVAWPRGIMQLIHSQLDSFFSIQRLLRLPTQQLLENETVKLQRFREFLMLLRFIMEEQLHSVVRAGE